MNVSWRCVEVEQAVVEFSWVHRRPGSVEERLLQLSMSRVITC